jgi:hypothetical protein
MNPRNITAANSSMNAASVLGEIVFEGYSADNAFSSENVTGVETKIGVDGIMSAGYVPTIKTHNVTLEASSSTIPILMNLAQLCEATKMPQIMAFSIEIPAVSLRFLFTASLTSWPPILSATRMLEPAQFGFQYSDVVAVPM